MKSCASPLGRFCNFPQFLNSSLILDSFSSVYFNSEGVISQLWWAVRSGIGRERVCMREAVNSAFQMKREERFPLNLSEEIKVSQANSFRTINEF